MTLDPRLVARALGGIVIGKTSVLAPGPGHSGRDRSLSIKIDPAAPNGFIVYSFAGDAPIDCRARVLGALGLVASRNGNQNRKHSRKKADAPVDPSLDQLVFAFRLWKEALDPRGTMVANYLSSRSLALPDDVAGSVVRFHPGLKYNGDVVSGMVALFRDIKTNAPSGIHRTFLDAGGRKLGRGMLGRVKQAAIKIDADENISTGLTIGEGFETCLAARLAGFRPVWAAGSAGAIRNFPLLPGVEALTILGELGDGGANHRASQACVDRWIEAEQEAFIATPLLGTDLNDAWPEVAP
jgi:putative DNA primase/helicase